MSETRLGGCYFDANTFMPDVFGYLLVKFDPKAVLDIGCGLGHTLEWFQKNGLCQIKGVEGYDVAVKESVIPGHVIHHDYNTGPAPLAQPFDLAWSAEFLEHVEEKYLPNVMPSFRLARYACITHAEPGQGGHHHVNCQTTQYWIEKFALYGFHYDANETEILRRTDRWKAGWGRRTLTFFRRIR